MSHLVQPIETIAHRVEDVLRAEHPKATLDQRFEVIGMDSLDYLDFIVKVEDEFDTSIPESEPFLMPRDVVKYLEAKCTSK